MQCEMRKINVPCIQLKVPQLLCDKLGLRPNQTIILKKSSHSLEISTLENDVICSTAPSHYNDSPLTEPENHVAGLEMRDTIPDNGNCEPKLSVLETSDSLSSDELDFNEQESSSDDEAVSTTTLHTDGRGTPLLTTTGADESSNKVKSSDETTEGTTNQPCENRNAVSGKNASERETELLKTAGPYYCEVCTHKYTQKRTFRAHRKHCAKYVTKLSGRLYPRECMYCNRFFKNKFAFCRHKKVCDGFKSKQTTSTKVNSTVRCESESTSNSSNHLDTEASQVNNVSDEEKTPKWIPVAITPKRALKYFVAR